MQLTIDHRGVWIPWAEENPKARSAHEAALIAAAEAAGGTTRTAVRVAGALGGVRFGLDDHRTVTPRSRKPDLPRGMAFVDYPTTKEMALAVDWAAGGVLAVLEGRPGVSRPALSGWAMAVGATNALTGEVADPLPDDIRTAFGSLVQYGNNGYGDARGNYFVRELVPQIAAEIRAAGYTDEFIVGYLIAYGLDEGNERNLRQVIRA